MIYRQTKNKLQTLIDTYKQVSRGKEKILREISLAEIPEMVYNSNAIENSYFPAFHISGKWMIDEDFRP